MTKAEKKSCANCKFLSEAVRVALAPGIEEQRLVCVKGCWSKGSVLSFSVYKNSGRFVAKALECGQFVVSDS
jgi:hypothetical protein